LRALVVLVAVAVGQPLRAQTVLLERLTQVVEVEVLPLALLKEMEAPAVLA